VCVRLTLDLNTDQLILGRGNASPVSQVIAARGAGPFIRVQPVRDGQNAALPEGFEMRWMVKAEGDWSGDSVAYADTFALASGQSFYEGVINYETAELNDLLLVGESGEKDSVDLTAQLAWRVDDEATWRPSQPVKLTLHNSVWRGTPGAPTPGETALDWLEDTLVAGAGISITPSGETLVVAGDRIVKFKAADQLMEDYGPDLIDDDTLQFPAPANSRWRVEMGVLVKATQGEFHAQITAPSGSTLYGRWKGFESVSGTLHPLDVEPLVGTESKVLDNAGATTLEHLLVQHFIVNVAGTGGDVKLRWHGGDYYTNDTWTQAGSWLIAERIA